MKTLSRLRLPLTSLCALGLGLGVLGCNDHPLVPLDKVISAASNDEIDLPAKTKLDFLFMIDNSGSMCEEQKNLSNNFSIISDFLFNELGQTADYRIAFISTDMKTEGTKGAFQSTPARPVPALSCQDPITGQADIPNTADCDDLLNDAADVDIDNQRVGGMVTLTFPNRSQIIVNLQKPLHEVWLAARCGGFHYRFDGAQWMDTKGQGEFFENLSRFATAQSGTTLKF